MKNEEENKTVKENMNGREQKREREWEWKSPKLSYRVCWI